MAKLELIETGNIALEKLLNEIFSSEVYTMVGIIQDSKGGLDPNEPKESNDNNSKSITLAEVATIHEFGTDKIPQRSFLRSTYEEEKRKITLNLITLAKIEAAKENPNMENVLAKIGAHMVGKVVTKFTVNNWAPLKDPTRGGRNKAGGGRPLIDTGQLRRSIGYKVVKAKSS